MHATQRFRRLEALQRSARKAGLHTRTNSSGGDSSDPLVLGGGAGEEAEVVLDEDGQRVVVPISTIGEEDEGIGALPGAARIVGTQHEISTTTQYLLTRQRLEVQARAGGLASMVGQGPDGAALARAAARGLKGKDSGE